MKKFIALIIILCLSIAAVAQDNYKLGDFGDSQVKAKSVNVGGSWTVKKSATTKGLEFWYGNASKATLSTAGAFAPVTFSTGAGTFTTVTATGAITTSGAGYFGYGTRFISDSVFYFPSRNTGAATWIPWNLIQSGYPRNRMSLQNMADYSVQSKAGTGQVLVMQRDTSDATSKVNLLAIKNITFDGTLNASSVTRGTASFTAALTRVAIYLAGITAVNSYVFVQATAPTDAFTRPVAGDFMNVKVINDSIIVMRQAGTTAGLTFDWFRIK